MSKSHTETDGPKRQDRGEDTRLRILDSAEHLFSENGIKDTSLREIVERAEANTASVHYYFGSKKGLIEEVFERRFMPVAKERLRRLADCHEEPGRPPLLTQIISAFVEPSLRGDNGGRVFARLRGRIAADASPDIREMMSRYLDPSTSQFLLALARALPDLPVHDLHWRFHFTFGAIVYSLADPGRIQSLTGNACDPSDTEAVLAYLVPFLAQAFQTPPIPDSSPGDDQN